MARPVLHFGDTIAFYGTNLRDKSSERIGGWLSPEGLVQSPMNVACEDFFTCLFTLVPSLSHEASTKLHQKDSSGAASRDELRVLEERARLEDLENKRELERTRGLAVRYGDTVELLHVSTVRYFAVSHRNADEERWCLKLDFLEQPNVDCEWVFVPKHKAKSEGDAITAHDQVIIMTKHNHMHVNVSSLCVSGHTDLKEVNASTGAARDMYWQPVLFSAFSKEIVPDIDVCVGHVVQIYNKDMDGFVTRNGRLVAPYKQTKGRAESFDTSTYWLVEFESRLKGGPIAAGVDGVQFRHLATGSVWTVDDSGPVFVPEYFGEARPRLQYGAVVTLSSLKLRDYFVVHREQEILPVLCEDDDEASGVMFLPVANSRAADVIIAQQLSSRLKSTNRELVITLLDSYSEKNFSPSRKQAFAELGVLDVILGLIESTSDPATLGPAFELLSRLLDGVESLSQEFYQRAFSVTRRFYDMDRARDVFCQVVERSLAWLTGEDLDFFFDVLTSEKNRRRPNVLRVISLCCNVNAKHFRDIQKRVVARVLSCPELVVRIRGVEKGIVVTLSDFEFNVAAFQSACPEALQDYVLGFIDLLSRLSCGRTDEVLGKTRSLIEFDAAVGLVELDSAPSLLKRVTLSFLMTSFVDAPPNVVHSPEKLARVWINRMQEQVRPLRAGSIEHLAVTRLQSVKDVCLDLVDATLKQGLRLEEGTMLFLLQALLCLQVMMQLDGCLSDVEVGELSKSLSTLLNEISLRDLEDLAAEVQVAVHDVRVAVCELFRLMDALRRGMCLTVLLDAMGQRTFEVQPVVDKFRTILPFSKQPSYLSSVSSLLCSGDDDLQVLATDLLLRAQNSMQAILRSIDSLQVISTVELANVYNSIVAFLDSQQELSASTVSQWLHSAKKTNQEECAQLLTSLGCHELLCRTLASVRQAPSGVSGISMMNTNLRLSTSSKGHQQQFVSMSNLKASRHHVAGTTFEFDLFPDETRQLISSSLELLVLMCRSNEVREDMMAYWDPLSKFLPESSAVLSAVIENCPANLAEISEDHIQHLCLVLGETKHPSIIELLRKLCTLNGLPFRKNQLMIMKSLLAERLTIVEPFINRESLRTAKQGGLSVKMLDLVTSTCLGRIHETEAKAQSILSVSDMEALLTDPTVDVFVKSRLTEFLFEVFYEVESVSTVHKHSVFKILEEFATVLDQRWKGSALSETASRLSSAAGSGENSNNSNNYRNASDGKKFSASESLELYVKQILIFLRRFARSHVTNFNYLGVFQRMASAMMLLARRDVSSTRRRLMIEFLREFSAQNVEKGFQNALRHRSRSKTSASRIGHQHGSSVHPVGSVVEPSHSNVADVSWVQSVSEFLTQWDLDGSHDTHGTEDSSPMTRGGRVGSVSHHGDLYADVEESDSFVSLRDTAIHSFTHGSAVRLLGARRGDIKKAMQLKSERDEFCSFLQHELRSRGGGVVPFLVRALTKQDDWLVKLGLDGLRVLLRAKDVGAKEVRLLVDCGAVELLFKLLMLPVNQKIALKFGVTLLEQGETAAEDDLLRLCRKRPSWIHDFRKLLRLSVGRLKEYGKDQQMTASMMLLPAVNDKLKRKVQFAKRLLRLMQLFCEGHHLAMQNFLRTQGTGKTYNLVLELVHLLHGLVRTARIATVPVIQQLFVTLTETVQGPCRENQMCLITGSIVCEVANGLFLPTFLPSLPAEDRKALLDHVIEFLLSLLERQDDEDALAHMRKILNLQLFRERIIQFHQTREYSDLKANMLSLLLSLDWDARLDANLKPIVAQSVGHVEISRDGVLERVFFPLPENLHITKAEQRQILFECSSDEAPTQAQRMTRFLDASTRIVRNHQANLLVVQEETWFSLVTKQRKALETAVLLLAFLINALLIFGVSLFPLLLVQTAAVVLMFSVRVSFWKSGKRPPTPSIVIYSVFHCLAAVLGLLLYRTFPQCRYLFAFHLFDLVPQSEMLQIVLMSITHNSQQLLLTSVFACIMVYCYSIIGFLLFAKDFITDEGGAPCNDLSLCFVTVLYSGLRNGGGIGDALAKPLHTDHFWLRILYDVSFWLICILILLNSFLGIIVDTFGELRQRKQQFEEEQKARCFVCGCERGIFDRIPGGFDRHIRDHYVWNYVYFFAYLALKDYTEYTGAESFVANLVGKKDVSFFPNHNALSLVGQEAIAKGETDEVQQQLERVLSRLDELEKKFVGNK